MTKSVDENLNLLMSSLFFNYQIFFRTCLNSKVMNLEKNSSSEIIFSDAFCLLCN